MVKFIDLIQIIIIILLIIFGIFVFYQITLKIIGGSWTTEAIIISLLMFNITFSVSIALNIIKFNTDYNYFKKIIYREVRDIKSKI